MNEKLNKDKIMDKIKKLQALTSSPNENEAAVALQKMMEFMDKHGISESMLDELENDTVKIETESWDKTRRGKSKGIKGWEIALASSIAKLFECRILINTKRSYATNFHKKHTGLIFFGTPQDIIVSKEMFLWIRNMLNDLAIKESKPLKSESDMYGGDFNSISFKNSFFIGATTRIHSRVGDILEARKAKYKDQQNTTAIMVINKKMALVNEAVNTESSGSINANMNSSDIRGRLLGAQAGNNINLNNQISRAKSTQIKQLGY